MSDLPNEEIESRLQTYRSVLVLSVIIFISAGVVVLFALAFRH